MPLIDVHGRFIAHEGDNKNQAYLGIESEQFIPDTLLSDLAHKRATQTSDDMLHVASIPVVVVEKWLREGFNIWQESAEAIVRRLKVENLDAFMATDKRI